MFIICMYSKFEKVPKSAFFTNWKLIALLRARNFCDPVLIKKLQISTFFSTCQQLELMVQQELEH